MKIWIITSEFPPYSGGGISTYGREFTRALIRLGHSVTVFVPQQEGVVENAILSQEGVRIVKVAVQAADIFDHSLGWWQLYSYRVAALVTNLLQSEPAPDGIEVHDYGGSAYYLMKNRLLNDTPLRDVPIVTFCHAPMFEVSESNEVTDYRFPTYWTGRTEKFCLMASDAIVTPGDFLAARLQKYNTNIMVSGIPFDVKAITPNTTGTKKYDLLFLGRTQLGKGILELLSTLKRGWDRGSQLKLRVVGGDTIWQSREISVRSFIEKNYGEHISAGLLTLDSHVDPQALGKVFASARAAVIPSRYDNFPYTCVEAMAHALPVIGSPNGGHAELIGKGEDRGLIVDFKSTSALDQINSFLALDNDELARLGLNCRRHVEQVCDPVLFAQRRVAHFGSVVPQVRKKPYYPFVNDVEVDLGRNRSQTSQNADGHLTVIVPYFNLHETIDETITSIMRSEYENIDVLIVNDGSTMPESNQKLDEIRNRKYRFPVSVLTTENKGLPSARNIGASTATGYYIAFLDADDRVRADYYRKAIGVLDEYENVDFVYSWLQYFEASSSIWITYDTDLPYLLCANMLSATLVLRRHKFQSFGQNDPRMKYGMEDYEAWVGMVASGCKGVALPELLTEYRVRPNSMSRQFTPNGVTWLYQNIVDFNSDIFKIFGAEVAKLLYVNGPGRLWNNPSQTYPELGYLEGEAGHTYRTLIGEFTPDQRLEIQKILFDPFARRTVSWMMKRGLHRAAFRVAKIALRLRDKVRL